MVNNYTNIHKTNNRLWTKESLNSDGHQLHLFQQNQQSLSPKEISNSDGHQLHWHQQTNNHLPPKEI